MNDDSITYGGSANGDPPRNEKGPGALAGATEAGLEKGPGGDLHGDQYSKPEPATIIELAGEREERKLAHLRAESRRETLRALAELGNYSAPEFIDEITAMGYRPMALIRGGLMIFLLNVPRADVEFDRKRARGLMSWYWRNRIDVEAEIIGRQLIYKWTRLHGAVRIGLSGPAVKLPPSVRSIAKRWPVAANSVEA